MAPFRLESNEWRSLSPVPAGVQLDGAVVHRNQLLEGLTLLYGDGGDADAYERRVIPR